MGNQKVSPEERKELLAAFERSGLSAAAFARHYGINYTTFCYWRRQAASLATSEHPRLVEVLQDAPENPVVEIQLGALCRIHVSHRDQAKLTAAIIRELEEKAC
jgi:transposase-like protein